MRIWYNCYEEQILTAGGARRAGLRRECKLPDPWNLIWLGPAEGSGVQLWPIPAAILRGGHGFLYWRRLTDEQKQAALDDC